MRGTADAERLQAAAALKAGPGVVSGVEKLPSVARDRAGMGNRFVQVLEEASKKKGDVKPLKRPSLAEEFFRENPMPWLLDADPVDGDRQSA